MSALSESLGNEAASHTLIHNSRAYMVRLIDQTAKTRFEKWLFSRAKDLARHLHEELMDEIVAGRPQSDDKDENADFANRVFAEEARFERRLETLNDDYVAGVYAFESELAAKALKTPAGLMALSADLFGVTRDEMFRLVVERGAEVKALISLVMKESLPQAPKRAEGDVPND